MVVLNIWATNSQIWEFDIRFSENLKYDNPSISIFSAKQHVILYPQISIGVRNGQTDIRHIIRSGNCSGSEELPSPALDPPTDTPIVLNLSVEEISSRAGYDAANLPADFMLFVKQDPSKGYSADAAVNCNYNYGNVHMTL